jgi:UDP-3-O-[3-hydroxymyristoyl] glucosamine N-acyltransferase
MNILSPLEFFRLTNRIRLANLSVSGLCSPAPDVEIHGVGQLGIVNEGYLTFCDRPILGSAVSEECCSLIVTSKEHADSVAATYPNGFIILADDPRAAFIDATQFLLDRQQVCHSSLLPQYLSVSADAIISEHARIEPGAQIDAGVTVAAGAIIRAGTWLQADASVGENSVIGSKGIYVYVGNDGARRAFPHLASVIVEQGASLGASCVVPRGILNSTRIGAGSIVGNLCNIGHGAVIGSNVWISSSTVVGGQTKIGHGVTIALGCSIRDNVSIGDNANVGMGSVVTKNVRSGQSVFGNPAKSFKVISAGPKR